MNDIINNFVMKFILPIIMVIAIILLCFLSIGLLITFIDCVILAKKHTKKGIIKSVNGISDQDTGFLSSGSVTKTTLLFKDGQMFTFDTIINHIKLNKKVILNYEKTPIQGDLIFLSLATDNTGKE